METETRLLTWDDVAQYLVKRALAHVANERDDENNDPLLSPFPNTDAGRDRCINYFIEALDNDIQNLRM